MAALSDYLENELLDLILHEAAWTPPSTVYLALFSSATTDSGGGTELSGGSYARQAVDFGAVASGSAANDSPVVFTNLPAATITHGALCDAASGGNFLLHGAFTVPKVVGAGDSLTMEVGDIVATLS